MASRGWSLTLRCRVERVGGLVDHPQQQCRIVRRAHRGREAGECRPEADQGGGEQAHARLLGYQDVGVALCPGQQGGRGPRRLLCCLR